MTESPSSPRHRLQSTDLSSEIEFLMARARAVGTTQANEQLAALNLKARSYAVLALACSPSRPSQRELAEFLSLDASQIVALVDGLESRGLVVREPDASDRRSNVIVGTPEGIALYERAAKVVAAAEAKSLSSLTESERNQLRELLARVAFEG